MSAAALPPAVAAALSRARDFVAARGAGREAVLLRVLLGEVPPDALAGEAAALQDERGALGPLLAGDAPGPGVASTADALGWLAAAGAARGDLAERAVAFLVGAQGEAGGWRDAAAPDEEAEVALSAAVAALLARAPSARLSSLRRAAVFLGARWSRARVQGGSYPAIAGYLAALATLPAEIESADEALQWCGRELERGFRSGAFGPVAVASVFVRCDAAALPGARLRADEVAAAVLAAQREDGSFPGEGPPERATCAAALALRHLAPALRGAVTLPRP